MSSPLIKSLVNLTRRWLRVVRVITSVNNELVSGSVARRCHRSFCPRVFILTFAIRREKKAKHRVSHLDKKKKTKSDDMESASDCLQKVAKPEWRRSKPRG